MRRLSGTIAKMTMMPLILGATGTICTASSSEADSCIPLYDKLTSIDAKRQWSPKDDIITFKLRNGIVGTVTLGSAEFRLAGMKGTLPYPVRSVGGSPCIPGSLWRDIQAEDAKYANAENEIRVFAVRAQDETAPLLGDEDTVDDLAIWVHPDDPGRSLLLGSSKAGGIHAYDLGGSQVRRYGLSSMNNIDVRYGFPLGGRLVDLAAATNITANTIDLIPIHPRTGELDMAASSSIVPAMPKVYGLSLYHSLRTGSYFAMLLGEEGEFEQYELLDDGRGRIAGKMVRSFRLASASEGMAADDEYGLLYIAEGDIGIWKYDAEPRGGTAPLIKVDTADGRRLQEDVEGLALYYGANGKGYLLASSQGSSSYAIYEREGNNAFVSSFTIEDGEQADRATAADGIDVSSFSLGDRYPHGLFVSQDDSNLEGDLKLPPNFKLVGWDSIAEGLDLPLPTLPHTDPRELQLRRSADE
ncbi:3-phytase [Paenibacillus phyllosphaerae]|uniref:3-phytase n=1 Tax=Paenibacillus phyllosphaerae TaxID=274593 RepID=A0A7W5B406_9BACL|nr:phytase [Paenibacillus phyllosphaerae]MBB3114005.1 3-phytase [Paenibacillus phyllosphaerae]